MVAAGVIAGVSWATRGDRTTKTDAHETPGRDIGLREEVRYGDLGVMVFDAKVDNYAFQTPSGKRVTHDRGMLAMILFKNHNPGAVAKAGSQAGKSTLVDDLGNVYPEIEPPATDDVRLVVPGRIARGEVLEIRADDLRPTDVLIFGRPVPAASELILTLDTKVYGGNEKLRVHIPKSW
jgi:hypothetical protein